MLGNHKKEDTEDFWSTTWENEKQHNVDADCISEQEILMENNKELDWKDILKGGSHPGPQKCQRLKNA